MIDNVGIVLWYRMDIGLQICYNTCTGSKFIENVRVKMRPYHMFFKLIRALSGIEKTSRIAYFEAILFTHLTTAVSGFIVKKISQHKTYAVLWHNWHYFWKEV